jgi:hypothetical protein
VLLREGIFNGYVKYGLCVLGVMECLHVGCMDEMAFKHGG